jgi:hypothetical protein
MGEALRDSGIDLIGDVRWGTHFCQFYETGDDLLDILVPYFKAGLENNEYCMWITSDPVGADRAREAIKTAVPEADRYLKGEQLEVVPYDRWHVIDGVFDMQRVLDGWVDRLNYALAKGYDGLRLNGNTVWLEKSDWASFTDYEEAIDSVIGRYRMMALSTYQASRCGVSEVADVIRPVRPHQATGSLGDYRELGASTGRARRFHPHRFSRPPNTSNDYLRSGPTSVAKSWEVGRARTRIA